MAITVILDANVLYPAPLRDLLIRIALTGVVHARWTEQILDECFRNILARRPDLTDAALRRTRVLMNIAVRDALVTGHEGLADGIVLPDPNDAHVLAAALRAEAQMIVTFNLKDFPDASLGPLGVVAKHPDEFLLEVIEIAPAAVIAAVSDQARALKSPPMTLHDLLDVLVGLALPQSVSRLRELSALSR